MASETPVLDPAAVASRLWRNGRGTTRELATGGGWRVSLADLAADGPFSHFPGVDRLFIPLDEGFELVVDGIAQPARRHQSIAFPGEAAVELRGLAAPTRALNVMTDRGTCRSEVQIAPATADPHPDATVRVLLGEHVAEVRVIPDSPSPLT